MGGSADVFDEASLTPRQIECLRLVEKGLSSKMIAGELGISPRTVDQHIGAAMDTLGVHNRLSAVALLKLPGPMADDDPAGFGESHPDPRFDSESFSLTNDTDFSETTSELAPYTLFTVPGGSPIAQMEQFQIANNPAPFLPPLGGRRNSARWQTRLRWIAKIAIISIMATSFVIMSVMVISALAPGGAG